MRAQQEVYWDEPDVQREHVLPRVWWWTVVAMCVYWMLA